jgi:hypothetical protein
MKISAPIITLLAGGALAGGLVVANGMTATAGSPASAVQVSGEAGDDGAAAEDAAGSAADENEAGEQDEAGAAGAGEQQEAPGAAAGGGEKAQGKEGAADAAENVRRTYAGRVQGQGKRPLLAISVRDGVAVAYLCDGKLEAWLKGTASDGRLSLKGEDGAKLSASFDADRAKGSVSVGERTFDFSVKTVKKPSGLWKAAAEVRGAKVQGGWIVLEDGTQVGMVTRDGAGASAPAIDAATGRTTIDGQVLTAVAADPDTGAGF